jgi:hypothetical protein
MRRRRDYLQRKAECGAQKEHPEQLVADVAAGL